MAADAAATPIAAKSVTVHGVARVLEAADLELLHSVVTQLCYYRPQLPQQ